MRMRVRVRINLCTRACQSSIVGSIMFTQRSDQRLDMNEVNITVTFGGLRQQLRVKPDISLSKLIEEVNEKLDTKIVHLERKCEEYWIVVNDEELELKNGDKFRVMDEEYHLIKDPIHGSIELHPLLYWITRTPAFHRLKYIKQLSGVYYVYPGATHTRFEHSIGVCYLAGEFARMLIKKFREEQGTCSEEQSAEEQSAEEQSADQSTEEQSAEEQSAEEQSAEEQSAEEQSAEERRQSIEEQQKIDNINILCIEIAGLCHDLGHGPFSHLFEEILGKYGKKGVSKKHEELSIKIFEDLIYNKDDKRFKLNGIKDAQLKMIKDMIHRSDNFEEEDLYLYEVVASKDTGIDVDKWDYFIRDCHYMGLQHEFDYRRLMQLSRIKQVTIDGKSMLKICYHKREMNNILGMFRTRCSLHLKAYSHKKVLASKIMLREAIMKVAELDIIHNSYSLIPKSLTSIKKIIEGIDKHPEGYLALDDGIIHVILNMEPKGDQQAVIIEAQKWLKDLHDDANFPHRFYRSKNLHTVASQEDIIEKIKNDVFKALKEEVGCQESEIYAEKVTLKYSSERERDPLKKVYFYKEGKEEPKLLGEKYEESLHLFTPKKWFLEEIWWYTTLEMEDDIISIIKKKSPSPSENTAGATE